jgi:hypothetical protein
VIDAPLSGVSIRYAGGPTPCARVDLVSDGGGFRVMALDLIDPGSISATRAMAAARSAMSCVARFSKKRSR